MFAVLILIGLFRGSASVGRRPFRYVSEEAKKRDQLLGTSFAKELFIPKNEDELASCFKMEEHTQDLKREGIVMEGDIKVTKLYEKLRDGQIPDFWLENNDYTWSNPIPYEIASAPEAKKKDTPACEGVVDVGFLLDSSGSVKYFYQQEKDFLKALANTFQLEKDRSHFSVASFSHAATLDIRFKEFYDQNAFNGAVDNIGLKNSITRIDRALKLVRDEMFQPHNGARDGIPKVLVLLTDGDQTYMGDAVNPATIADDLRDQGVDIIVVGVGKLNETQLADIAGKRSNVFLVQGFKELLRNDFVDSVKRKSCESGNLKHEIELVRNNLVTIIPIFGAEFTIYFELKPTLYAIDAHSVMRIQLDHKHYFHVWFTDNGSGLLVVTAMLGFDIFQDITSGSKILLGRWTRVKISQQLIIGEYWFVIEVAGRVLLSRKNTDVKEFTRVAVYASDKDMATQAGFIRNLDIHSGNEGYLIKQETEIKRGELLTTIPTIEKEYVLTFDFQPHNLKTFHSVLHVTTGDDPQKYGSRNPAIWFNKDGSGSMTIASSVSDNPNSIFDTDRFPENVWTHVSVSQHLFAGDYMYSIKINGTEVHSARNDAPVALDDLMVYAGSPNFHAQPGWIRKLKIVSGKNKEKEPTQTMCDGVVDLGFLMDSSGSLKNKFGVEKSFLKTVAGGFGISKDGTHAGVVSFSSMVKEDVKLTDCTDTPTFEGKVDEISHMNGYTRIDLALEMALYDLFTPASGARQGVPKILILITDGEQNPVPNGVDIKNPADIAAELRAKKVRIIAVGVGAKIKHSNLLEITGVEENTFTVKDFDELISKEFIDKIKKVTCSAGDLKEERELSRGNQVTILPKLGREFTISFEVKPTSFTTGLQSLLHFTLGNDNEDYGDRIPALWFNEDDLVITMATNGTKSAQFISKDSFLMNLWTQVTISQTLLAGGHYYFEVKVRDKVVYSTANTGARDFHNVKVYAGDPWHPSQTGSIRKLSVINDNQGYILRGESEIKQGKMVAKLAKLDKEFEVSFEVKPDNFKPLHNVLHMGRSTDDSYGSHLPSVWFDSKGSGKLHVASSINKEPLYTVSTQEGLAIDKWAHVRISQLLLREKYLYEVEVNGKELVSIENTHAQDFENIKIFISNPIDDSQPGLIRNLIFKNGHDDIELRKVVKASIANFHDHTCLRFVPRSHESDYLVFQPTEGCYSEIGRTGGEQAISVGPGCRWKGTVSHLIMHSLGFLHEHTRNDQSEHITVNYDNIKDKYKSNFKPYSAGQRMGTEYDLLSLMQYRSFAFSMNGNATIAPTNSDFELRHIGQRRGFSRMDIEKISKAFKCSAPIPSKKPTKKVTSVTIRPKKTTVRKVTMKPQPTTAKNPKPVDLLTTTKKPKILTTPNPVIVKTTTTEEPKIATPVVDILKTKGTKKPVILTTPIPVITKITTTKNPKIPTPVVDILPTKGKPTKKLDILTTPIPVIAKITTTKKPKIPTPIVDILTTKGKPTKKPDILTTPIPVITKITTTKKPKIPTPKVDILPTKGKPTKKPDILTTPNPSMTKTKTTKKPKNPTPIVDILTTKETTTKNPDILTTPNPSITKTKTTKKPKIPTPVVDILTTKGKPTKKPDILTTLNPSISKTTTTKKTIPTPIIDILTTTATTTSEPDILTTPDSIILTTPEKPKITSEPDILTAPDSIILTTTEEPTTNLDVLTAPDPIILTTTEKPTTEPVVLTTPTEPIDSLATTTVSPFDLTNELATSKPTITPDETDFTPTAQVITAEPDDLGIETTPAPLLTTPDTTSTTQDSDEMTVPTTPKPTTDGGDLTILTTPEPATTQLKTTPSIVLLTTVRKTKKKPCTNEQQPDCQTISLNINVPACGNIDSNNINVGQDSNQKPCQTGNQSPCNPFQITVDPCSQNPPKIWQKRTLQRTEPKGYPHWPRDFTVSKTASNVACCHNNKNNSTPATKRCQCSCFRLPSANSEREFLCHEKKKHNPNFIVQTSHALPMGACISLPPEVRGRYICYARSSRYNLYTSDVDVPNKCVAFMAALNRRGYICAS